MIKELLVIGFIVLTANITQAEELSAQVLDYEYEIEALGVNGKVYEFTPQSDKTKRCVVVKRWGAHNLAMQCFTVTEQQESR
jgi:hypothetical protein